MTYFKSYGDRLLDAYYDELKEPERARIKKAVWRINRHHLEQEKPHYCLMRLEVDWPPFAKPEDSRTTFKSFLKACLYDLSRGKGMLDYLWRRTERDRVIRYHVLLWLDDRYFFDIENIFRDYWAMALGCDGPDRFVRIGRNHSGRGAIHCIEVNGGLNKESIDYKLMMSMFKIICKTDVGDGHNGRARNFGYSGNGYDEDKKDPFTKNFGYRWK